MNVSEAAAAIRGEREACARLAASDHRCNLSDPCMIGAAGARIADLIRARNTP